MPAGSALFASFVLDMESNMRSIATHEYDALNRDMWWSQVAKETPLNSKKERIAWLLDTATIEYVNRLGGELNYDEIVSNAMEISYKVATGALKLNRYQMQDLYNGIAGGEAMALAAHWSRQMGAYAAYWPQKQVAAAIRDGSVSTSLGYDGVTYFNASHPYNPFDTGPGVFANVLTGAASGSYPGAVPITGNTLDVALDNLHKAISYVRTIKMPTGADPRGLRVAGILHPSAMAARVTELTQAKFIPRAAASGGGSSDVAAVVASLGFGTPICADELGAGFTNGSDSTFYLLCEQTTSDQLGAIIYGNREPFSIQFHDGVSSAELNRANELEWTTRGANKVSYGHPFLLFKCMAT